MLLSYMELEILSVQAGFRKGRHTQYLIAKMCWVLECSKEFRKKVGLCFTDYSKTFDWVGHEKLWLVWHRKWGLGWGLWQLIVLMHKVYCGEKATVRTEQGETESCPAGKGVRQGYILHSYLFNLCTKLACMKSLPRLRRRRSENGWKKYIS